MFLIRNGIPTDEPGTVRLSHTGCPSVKSERPSGARFSLSKKSWIVKGATLNPYIPAAAVHPAQRIARFGRFPCSFCRPGAQWARGKTWLSRQKTGFLTVSSERPSGARLPSGVPGEIRTPGLPLRRRTLYPAELRKPIRFLRVSRKAASRSETNYTEADVRLSTGPLTNAAYCTITAAFGSAYDPPSPSGSSSFTSNPQRMPPNKRPSASIGRHLLNEKGALRAAARNAFSILRYARMALHSELKQKEKRRCITASRRRPNPPFLFRRR